MTELFRRILRNIVPIEFKVFFNKYIKMQELETEDSLDNMVNKIKINCEM